MFCKDDKHFHLLFTGELLCHCILYGSCTIDSWKRSAFESCIDPSSLLHSAICYWLQKPLGSNAKSELMLFMNLMAAVTSLSSKYYLLILIGFGLVNNCNRLCGGRVERRDHGVKWLEVVDIMRASNKIFSGKINVSLELLLYTFRAMILHF